MQLFLMLICLVVCIFYEQQGDNRQNRHRYVTFIIWILIFQSALRHLGVGADTLSYYKDFLYTRDSRSWQDIWHNFYDVYVLGKGKDAGYWLLMKVFSSVCPYFLPYLLFVAIIFFFPLYRLIEKHLYTMKQLFLSFCVYQVMFYSFFSITGIRQTIATVATFYGVKFIEERKLLKFVLIIFLASFIHKSVLLFLPFYFISRLPMNRTLLFGTICLLPVVFNLSRPLAALLVEFSGSDAYAMYAESDMVTGGAFSFLMFILGAGCLTLFATYRNSKAIPVMMVHAMSLAVFFTPLMWVDTSLMRVIQYYSIFCLITIPLAIDNLAINKRGRVLLYWCLILILVLTTVRHNYEYAFFWQEMKLPYLL